MGSRQEMRRQRRYSWQLAPTATLRLPWYCCWYYIRASNMFSCNPISLSPTHSCAGKGGRKDPPKDYNYACCVSWSGCSKSHQSRHHNTTHTYTHIPYTDYQSASTLHAVLISHRYSTVLGSPRIVIYIHTLSFHPTSLLEHTYICLSSIWTFLLLRVVAVIAMMFYGPGFICLSFNNPFLSFFGIRRRCAHSYVYYGSCLLIYAGSENERCT
ncbi:hypothetical protein BC939DRAFT_247558 [Gamsiella multidivaricata]|uniref:uncharacterized protein n=1 Tax=Gamsiella multidivaricata TaxID=101098 RepID=UPI00221E68CA|nr:uncharacterized protein BC939DRAFT_247558 [Gamsiella multidivaricata]KAI7819777.1 hypothetical protein BC939DRAFT_247558 [Gamsiella multidivaricata]